MRQALQNPKEPLEQLLQLRRAADVFHVAELRAAVGGVEGDCVRGGEGVDCGEELDE
jgi:hypothetical protein